MASEPNSADQMHARSDEQQPSEKVCGDGQTQQNGLDGQPARLVYLKPKFLETLLTVGATTKYYTIEDVLALLKKYLFQNKFMFDEKCKFVNCAGTALGEAFGVDKFEFDDVGKLLSQNISFSPYIHKKLDLKNYQRSNSSDSSSSCNALSECSSSGVSSCQSGSSQDEEKSIRTCKNHFNIALKQAPESDSGQESEHSFQGYATVVCDDSDDELLPTENGSGLECEDVEGKNDDHLSSFEMDVLSEYEPVSEDSDNHEELDSDSEEDVIVIDFDLVDVDDDALWGEEGFADESATSESDDGDTEDGEEHRRDCVSCGVTNESDMSYCLKCWQVRKEMYPDPPKKRHRRRLRSKKGRRLSTQTPADSSGGEGSKEEGIAGEGSFDSGFDAGAVDSETPSRKRKSSESIESPVNKTRKVGDDDAASLSRKMTKWMRTSRGREWLLGSKGLALREEIGNFSSDEDCWSIDDEPMCTLCCSRPRNASVIHGNVSHVAFCYPCARRLHNAKKRCPICRRKIHMVTKNVMV